MVTLLTALVSLVDEWKKHAGAGVRLEHVVGKIDSALAAQMLTLTSDSPTRSIVSVIEVALTAHSYAAVDAAEDVAEQYGSKKALVAETTLEAFLSEIWPKAPRTRLSRSGPTRTKTAGLGHLTI